jgi:LytS/YehU family sensor histidine kinase
MRYLLESSKTEQVSLQKEVKFLKDYLALEKVRLAQNAAITFEVSGIDKDIFVAPLLFIPLVENAFKHGLQSISANNFAHFSLALQENELYFEAKNSVDKILDAQSQSGTGLENLSKRLMLIYPDNHLLHIENKGGVFKITLQLSL